MSAVGNRPANLRCDLLSWKRRVTALHVGSAGELAQRVRVCPFAFAHHPQLEDIYCSPLLIGIGTQSSNCQHIKSHRACSGDGHLLLARISGCPKAHPVHLLSTDASGSNFPSLSLPTLSPLCIAMRFLLFVALPGPFLPLTTNSCSFPVCF
jgi:hypothetical protein